MAPRRAAEGTGRRLDFELPFTGKIVLLAAFVCSCNSPALDKRLFDASVRAGRRRGSMAADRQACGFATVGHTNVVLKRLGLYLTGCMHVLSASSTHV